MMEPRRTLESRWQNDLPNRLFAMLESGEFSDCAFIVGADDNVKEFQAHKVIMSAASPVFKAMLTGDLDEEGPIAIADIQPNVFQMLLDFIYTDRVTLNTFEEARDLWYAADKCRIAKLIRISERKVQQVLSSSNACQAFEIAQYFERFDLMHSSLEIIMNEISMVIRHPSFVKVQLSTLLMILDSDKLNAPGEHFLLHATMLWGMDKCRQEGIPANGVNLRAATLPALKKIKFHKLTTRQFMDAMAVWNVMTEEEYSAILTDISQNNSVALIGVGFYE